MRLHGRNFTTTLIYKQRRDGFMNRGSLGWCAILSNSLYNIFIFLNFLLLSVYLSVSPYSSHVSSINLHDSALPSALLLGRNSSRMRYFSLTLKMPPWRKHGTSFLPSFWGFYRIFMILNVDLDCGFYTQNGYGKVNSWYKRS